MGSWPEAACEVWAAAACKQPLYLPSPSYLNPSSFFHPLRMTPAQQHPEIRPHDRIKGRNVRSAACQEISYIACTLGGMLIILELVGALDEFFRQLLLSAPLNLKETTRLIISKPSHQQALHYEPWPSVLCSLCTIKCCGQLESRKGNSCCVSVCL